MRSSHESCTDADLAFLEMLTGPQLPTQPKATFARRDAPLDPLLMAATLASGPQITRNHYTHDFFPGVMLPAAEGAWDWTKFTGQDADAPQPKRLTYVSRQGPRKVRVEATYANNKENSTSALNPTSAENQPPRKRRVSTADYTSTCHCTSVPTSPHSIPLPQLEVKCMARTRIPTPHGPAFLHLYHNNRDNKEHLAIVIDPSQYSETPGAISTPPVRSRSLDAIWSSTETEMDRITRGAYVGRLSQTNQRASQPPSDSPLAPRDIVPSPLIRIHSECFTGETVGSMRCDCGEQLDEAIRLISQPITIPSSSMLSPSTTIPGRGAVVYLRQEGRGIGLLSKIRAYNLQDLGHDTVTANLMLGHGADERGYDLAIAILRDLGLGDEEAGEGVRVLTNNPDKVEALEKDGLRVVERVPMIPRSWKARHAARSNAHHKEDEAIVGDTLIGGNVVYGEDLDNYLRTKVLRMGHMLPLWMDGVNL